MSKSSIMNDSSEEDQLPPGVSAVLRHPSGVDVFLVGVAHFSEKSCEDVVSAIVTTKPELVFIELDAERLDLMVYTRGPSDPYGIKTRGGQGFLPSLRNTVLKGDFVPFGINIIIKVAGALVGAPSGNEILMAVVAADQVGAKVILGDRSLQATGQRMSQAMSSQAVSDVRKAIGSLSAVSKSPSTEDVTKPVEDTWQSDMLKAGCTDPDTVIASFKRIIKQGLLPRGSIDKEDGLIVRECGQKVVERTRQTYLTEGDNSWALEEDALTKVGMDASIDRLERDAMKVLIGERDLILARGLYEAGERTGNRPVVGVVGAGHVKGIQEQWSLAGTPEASQEVAGVMEAPSPDLAGSFAYKAITGACIGLLAYKKPRLAAKLLGSGVLVTGATLSLMAGAAHRLQICAERIIEMDQEISTRTTPSDDEDSAYYNAWWERIRRVIQK